MRPMASYALLAAVLYFSSLPLTGCYTQLAIGTDDPEGSVETLVSDIAPPSPPIFIYEPVPIYPVAPPPTFWPSPVVPSPVVTSPAVGVQSVAQPTRRETGSTRTSSSDTRSSGNTRRGR
jgi:hypothetical protein